MGIAGKVETRTLVLLLGINAAMFVVELAAGARFRNRGRTPR